MNYYLAAEATDPAAADQAEQLVSEDRSTLLIPVTLIGEADDVQEEAETYVEALHGQATEAVTVNSVGDMTINETFNRISEEDLQRAEIVGLPIALIVLIVVFGALVAALIPVGMALAAVAIATGIAALIGTRFELSFFITNMITVIGLAVGYRLRTLRDRAVPGRATAWPQQVRGDRGGRRDRYQGRASSPG